MQQTMSAAKAIVFFCLLKGLCCDLCPRYPVGTILPEQHHIYSNEGLLDIRLVFMVIMSMFLASFSLKLVDPKYERGFIT